MRIYIFILFLIPFSLSSQTYVDSVFEFDIGDEFHFKTSYAGSSPYDRKEKRIIIAKSIFGSVVKYKFHIYGLENNPYFPTFRYSRIDSVFYSNYSDTLIDTIPACLDSLHPFYDSTLSPPNSGVFRCNKTDSIETDVDFGLIYSFLNQLNSHFWKESFYSKHIGRYHYYEKYIDGGGYSYTIREDMVYFKKNSNNKTWGNPYIFTSSLIENSELNFSIFPNPATNYINIQAIEDKLKFSISNTLGQEVYFGDVHNKLINCSNLDNGIYFLKLIDENQRVGIKRIIISR